MTRTDAEQEAIIASKRTKRMERIDAMPYDQRELVKEYGLSLVEAFLTHGVTRPASIKHLIETTLNERSPLRHAGSIQGIRATGRD